MILYGVNANGVEIPLSLDSTGALQIVSSGSSGPTDVTLLNAVTTATVGSLAVGNYKEINLEIYGTATSIALAFKGSLASGANTPVAGVRKSDFSTGTTGGMGEVWTIPIAGLQTFVVDLTTVTGGNVTVKGKVS